MLFVGNHLIVFFVSVGPSKKEPEPTTCHTNFPARPQCGVYYFEIRVVQLGQDGIFAIGVCRENHKLNKLPGKKVYLKTPHQLNLTHMFV